MLLFGNPTGVAPVTPREHDSIRAVRPVAPATAATAAAGATRTAAAATGALAPAPLVLGFGNVLLGDDGAGVRIVDRLRAQSGDSDCQCIDGGTMSFNLLAYVEAAHAMLVVDAAEMRATPGTVFLFEGNAMDEFLQGARRRTVHEIGLMDLLDMARLEASLPPRRALLCVQPGPIGWSDALSAAVAAALPAAVGLAAAQLQRWSAA
jgi:hydrogenase maturation protease